MSVDVSELNSADAFDGIFDNDGADDTTPQGTTEVATLPGEPPDSQVDPAAVDPDGTVAAPPVAEAVPTTNWDSEDNPYRKQLTDINSRIEQAQAAAAQNAQAQAARAQQTQTMDHNIQLLKANQRSWDLEDQSIYNKHVGQIREVATSEGWGQEDLSRRLAEYDDVFNQRKEALDKKRVIQLFPDAFDEKGEVRRPEAQQEAKPEGEETNPLEKMSEAQQHYYYNGMVGDIVKQFKIESPIGKQVLQSAITWAVKSKNQQVLVAVGLGIREFESRLLSAYKNNGAGNQNRAQADDMEPVSPGTNGAPTSAKYDEMTEQQAWDIVQYPN